jgi:hypothetical protein
MIAALRSITPQIQMKFLCSAFGIPFYDKSAYAGLAFGDSSTGLLDDRQARKFTYYSALGTISRSITV